MEMIGARMLHEMLVDTVEITDLYSGRGSHDGCGECCSRFLPLTAHEAMQMRLAARNVEVRPPDPDADIDFTCPFLDEDKRCMVYEIRPSMCRAYNCAEHKALGALAAVGKIDPTKHYELHDMRELVGR